MRTLLALAGATLAAVALAAWVRAIEREIAALRPSQTVWDDGGDPYVDDLVPILDPAASWTG